MGWNPGGGSGSSGAVGGDLAGTLPNPTVDGIQGSPVSAVAPSLTYLLGWDGSQWSPQPGGQRGFHVKAYGAKGDGVADDTAAINAAWAALLAAGEGVLIFEDTANTNYRIDGQVTFATTATQTQPLVVTGYGATLRLKTAASCVVCYQANGTSWRNFRIQGLSAAVDSNAVVRCFWFGDADPSNVSTAITGSFWTWEARDLNVYQGVASAPACTCIEVTQTQNVANCVFQFKITNPVIPPMTTNTTKPLIYLHNSTNGGGTSGISSAEISNPNTYGGLVGIQVGTSGRSIAGIKIDKGTVNASQTQLILMYAVGGCIDGTHVEGAGLNGVNVEQIYVEGSCSCLFIDSHRGTISAHETNVIRIFATNQVSLIQGMGNIGNGTPWLKIVPTDANRTGTVRTIGLYPPEVDWSTVTSTTGPEIDIDVSRFPQIVSTNAGANVTLGQVNGAAANVGLSSYQRINCADATAFTINDPANYAPGQIMVLEIFNGTGGALGGITYPGSFKFASSAAPALPAASHANTITFVQRAPNQASHEWAEIARATALVT